MLILASVLGLLAASHPPASPTGATVVPFIVSPSRLLYPKSARRAGFVVTVRLDPAFRDQTSNDPEEHLVLELSTDDWTPKSLGALPFYSSYGMFSLGLVDLTGDGFEELVLVTGSGRGTNVRQETLVVYQWVESSFHPILSTPFSGFFGLGTWRYEPHFLDVTGDGTTDLRLVLSHDDPDQSPLNNPEAIPKITLREFAWDRRMGTLKLVREEGAPEGEAKVAPAPTGTDCGPPSMTFGVSIRGRRQDLVLTQQEVDASARWKPGDEGQAPLSIGRAAQLAFAEVRRYFHHPEAWHLHEITLMPYCSARWLYQVSWGGNSRNDTSRLTLPVLMTGAAVSLDGLTSLSAGEGQATSAADFQVEANEARPCVRPPFGLPNLVDGRLRQIEVPAKDVEASPAWDPATGAEIPVSVDLAARLATAEFRRSFPNRESWRLGSISLRPLCDSRWLYEAWWSPEGTGEEGQIAIPVLLSGKAVPLDSLRQ
ncbi:MAG: hypothetical protein HY049_01835 [Acidobacteria bacterium]|nr:hypothetical protein [Acidobacteriota bacterium]